MEFTTTTPQRPPLSPLWLRLSIETSQHCLRERSKDNQHLLPNQLSKMRRDLPIRDDDAPLSPSSPGHPWCNAVFPIQCECGKGMEYRTQDKKPMLHHCRQVAIVPSFRK